MNYLFINSISELNQSYNGKYIQFNCEKCGNLEKSQFFIENKRFNFGLLCLKCFNKTLKDYYKNNPIIINSIDDFNNIHILQGQYIKYKCEKCNIENIQLFNNSSLKKLKKIWISLSKM